MLICQSNTTQNGFWGCVYAQGYADNSIIEVLQSWNTLFATYNAETDMYHWLDVKPSWEWGSMPQAASDTDASAEAIASNVAQATIIRVTKKELVPNGVLVSLAGDDVPFYKSTIFKVAAIGVLAVGGYFAYKKFR